MRKSLLTLSVVGLIVAGGLTSCSSVTSKKVDGKQVIITIGDTNYTADDLFDQYRTTTSGAQEYYSVVRDTLIRHYIRGEKYTRTMKNAVDTEIDNFTKEAKQNASTNGTSYKSELSSKLSDEGVDDLKELREKYILAKKTTAVENEFYQIYTNSERTEKNENLINLTKEYINTNTPYHVKHILVKTSIAGSSFYKGSITETEAKSINSVVTRLASGKETFGQVAQTGSDDSSSKYFGDLGIMDRNSSYVSEFKYGVFSFDYLLNGDVTAENKAKLSVPSTVANANNKTIDVTAQLQKEVKGIPYSVIQTLGEKAAVTKATTNVSEFDAINADDKASYYPRNLIFNQYFNNHGLSFIVKDAAATGVDASRFKSFSTILGGEPILVDENENPIIVTRAGTGTVGDDSGSSYQGIHFIVVQQSPLTVKNLGNFTSIEDYLVNYYSFETPKSNMSDSDWEAWGTRFVTYLSTNSDTYSSRAVTVENDIKNFDSNVQFRLYDYVYNKLVEDGSISEDKWLNQDVKDQINKYISETRAKTAYNNAQTYNTAWADYVRLLQLQDSEKTADNQLDYSTNMTKYFA